MGQIGACGRLRQEVILCQIDKPSTMISSRMASPADGSLQVHGARAQEVKSLATEDKCIGGRALINGRIGSCYIGVQDRNTFELYAVTAAAHLLRFEWRRDSFLSLLHHKHLPAHKLCTAMDAGQSSLKPDSTPT